MDNLTSILNEFEKLKGQFVICHYEVMQLIAISEDNIDYYYALYDGRKIRLHSCVGSITQLKDKIDKSDYDEMVRVAKLNFFSSSECFIYRSKEVNPSQHIEDLTKKYQGTCEFITEIHWQII